MWDRIKAPFLYWAELYQEIRIWAVFRRAAFDNQKMLDTEHRLRVDWLGRIYGVINIPEEVDDTIPLTPEQVEEYKRIINKSGVIKHI